MVKYNKNFRIYEDFEMSDTEVKQLFEEILLFVSITGPPGLALMKCFNNFAVRAAFNRGFLYQAD